MAVVDEPLQSDATEHTSNASLSSMTRPQPSRQKQPLESSSSSSLASAPNASGRSNSTTNNNKKTSNKLDFENLSTASTASIKDQDFEDDDDLDDESRHNYLLNSLLAPKNPPRRDTNPNINNSSNSLTMMHRSDSSHSLSERNFATKNDDNCLDEDRSWNTMSSVHSSRTDLSNNSRTNLMSDDDKNWQSMNSIHSRASSNAGGLERSSSQGGGVAPCQPPASVLPPPTSTDFGASMEFNDSCCSFNSFGGSDSSLNELSPDLSLQRAAFKNLSEDSMPSNSSVTRRNMLLKSVPGPSVGRSTRHLDFRPTGLTLIDESSSLD